MRLLRLRRSFPARLFAAVFAVGAATVVLTATVSYRSAELALRERLLQQLSNAVDDDAARLAAWLAQQRAATELLAHGAKATEGARNAQPQAASVPPLPAEVLSAELIQVVSVPGGRIERASDSSTVGQYAVDQLHYREAQRGTYIQPIYPGGPHGRPRLTIATPIRNDSGRVTSIVAVHLDLGAMERVLTRADSTLGVDAYLVNRFAEFVSAERFGRDGVLRGLSSKAIHEALAARDAASDCRKRLRPRRCAGAHARG